MTETYEHKNRKIEIRPSGWVVAFYRRDDEWVDMWQEFERSPEAIELLKAWIYNGDKEHLLLKAEAMLKIVKWLDAMPVDSPIPGFTESVGDQFYASYSESFLMECPEIANMESDIGYDPNTTECWEEIIRRINEMD